MSGDDAQSLIRAARTASEGSIFQFLPDGSRVFRVRVDVRDFSPDELSVSTDGRRLIVTARQSADRRDG